MSTPVRPSDRLVGRDPDLAVIARMLFEAGSHPGAVVLEGEAGIGKTALWQSAVSGASREGLNVVACRPVSGETRLSFAALDDLLGPQLANVASRLPTPQRRALEVAFLRVDPGSEAIDQRTIAAATLSTFRELGADRPTLLAIDDVQWLDGPSETALVYAVRRLGSARVSVLASVRRDAGARETAFEAALESRQETTTERLRVAPLSPSDLHLVIRDRLGVSFTHQVLSRLHDVSGGNPFHALELARVLARRSQPLDLGRALPVPERLRVVVQESLDGLSSDAQELAAMIAALSSPTLETADAAGMGEFVDETVRAGVLELHDEELRFTHPLLASAALGRLGPRERRALHRRLARIVDGEERARHLALGASGPSVEIAGELDAAARAAAGRGATGTAAELAATAVRLTPADRSLDRARRELEAAGYEIRNGDWHGARGRLEPLLETLPAGETRAVALLRLARLEDTTRHLALCRRAIAEATSDRLLAEANQLAAEGSMMAGDVPGAIAHARKGAQLAEDYGDTALLVECLGTLCHYETYTGAITPGLLERAVDLEGHERRASNNYSPRTILGLRLMYGDRLDDARTLLEAGFTTAAELGDEYSRFWLLGQLTQLECRAGRLAEADRLARDAAIVSEQIGMMEMNACFLTALVGLHLGRVEETRAAATRGAALAAAEGYELFRVLNVWAHGLLELSLGNADAADVRLRSLPESVDAMGYLNPGVRPVYADAIEARIAAGDLDVDPLVDELERRGRVLDNAWARATAARCRGLLLAGRGAVEASIAELERALREHESCPQPLELGRTLLAFGSVERRAKHRGAARDALTRALELFDALGAPLWAERAASELQRLPGRRPAASDGLTETERQIAELVAAGLSNKQVAARLFIAVRTVEANLTKIYAKLGIRSRTELAARLTR